MRAALGMCALLAGLGLAACDSEPPLLSAQRGEPPHSARVVVVKSEITLEDRQGVAQQVSLGGDSESMSDAELRPMLETKLGSGYVCDHQGSDVVCKRTSQPPITCGLVMEHLNSALFAYEPAYMALAGTYAPRVLASCHQDAWPDALKQCIAESSP